MANHVVRVCALCFSKIVMDSAEMDGRRCSGCGCYRLYKSETMSLDEYADFIAPKKSVVPSTYITCPKCGEGCIAAKSSDTAITYDPCNLCGNKIPSIQAKTLPILHAKLRTDTKPPVTSIDLQYIKIEDQPKPPRPTSGSRVITFDDKA